MQTVKYGTSCHVMLHDASHGTLLVKNNILQAKCQLHFQTLMYSYSINASQFCSQAKHNLYVKI